MSTRIDGVPADLYHHAFHSRHYYAESQAKGFEPQPKRQKRWSELEQINDDYTKYRYKPCA